MPTLVGKEQFKVKKNFQMIWVPNKQDLYCKSLKHSTEYMFFKTIIAILASKLDISHVIYKMYLLAKKQYLAIFTWICCLNYA